MVGIYKITNKVNGHSYIGQSRHIEERWQEHIRNSKNEKTTCYNYPLQRAFRKYGVDNFVFSVLEQCKIEELDDKEKFWITREKPQYNQSLETTVNVVSWKLSCEQVKEIQNTLIKDVANEIEYKELAEKYGVSEKTISDINVGHTWYNESLSYPLRKTIRARQLVRKYFCVDCGKEITKGAVRCLKCKAKAERIVNRPSREELKGLIRKESFVQIGKKYGVTDNAIRKWCKAENLPTKKSDINKYTDKEWLMV